MIVTLQTERVRTLDQVRAFVEGSEAVDFAGAERESVYEFVRRALVRLDYERFGKSDKGLVRRYMAKVTGLSRAQLTRLIGQHRETGHIEDRRAPLSGATRGPTGVAFDGGGAGRHGGRLLQRMRGRHSIAIAATGINSRHRSLRPVDGIPGSVTYENRRNRDEFLPDRSSRLRVRNRGTGEKCGSTKSLGDTVTDGRASYAASSSRRARARS